MSSIKTDLQQLIISSEIENGIEYKLQSIKSLVDALEIGEEQVQTKVFYALSNLIYDVINDIQPLKERIDYMFSLTQESK